MTPEEQWGAITDATNELQAAIAEALEKAHAEGYAAAREDAARVAENLWPDIPQRHANTVAAAIRALKP